MGMYDTRVLLDAVKKIYPVSMFFRNRYFTTLPRDIYPTSEVLVEYKKGSRKMAPFVVPEIGGIMVERDGYRAERYEPAYIAPERLLTIDTLNKKGFGEAFDQERSPQDRQREILGEDIADLGERIDRREEWMCSELFTKGEICMLHKKDREKVLYEKRVLRFYEDVFDNEYIPAVKWHEKGADIYGDLDAMVGMVTEKGNPVTDLLLGAQAVLSFLKDSVIQDLFNNRRMEMGQIDPKMLPSGVGYLGRIVVRGRPLDIFVYDERYEDDNGEEGAFLPADRVILTAPNMGRFAYGAITQIEQNDGEYHTYRGIKVPKYISDADNNIRKLRLSSAPVAIPYDANSWAVAKVV